jgi:hypothetical protein
MILASKSISVRKSRNKIFEAGMDGYLQSFHDNMMKVIIEIKPFIGVFEVRRNTYANDKDKILFARSFLEGVPAEDWERLQTSIDLAVTAWAEFIDFLQEHLNPKHLRLLETNARLKKVRQLNGQSVADLIVYLNSLETQVPQELKEETFRHSNARRDSNDCLNIK